MAYRGGAPGEAVVVHAGVLAPWRGLVVAGTCALAAGLVWRVAGLEGIALAGPMGALASFALATTAWRARWVSVRALPRALVILVTERGLRGVVEREIEVTRDAELRVDAARDESWLGQLPVPALRASAIVLATEGGVAPITSRLPGIGRQRAIAAKLAGLFTPPPPVRGEDAIAPATWTNVRVFALFATMTTLSTIVGFAIQNESHGRTGRLEVVCTERCLFDGMECLPGGAIAGRYEPGERLVQVADPSAPGGLRPVWVPVVLGHRTVFECREDATVPAPTPEP